MVVANLKKIFKKDTAEIPPFKQFNYLNLLPEKNISDLLFFAEQIRFLTLAPETLQKKILLISLYHSDFLTKIQNPAFCLDYRLNASHFPYEDKKIHCLRGDLKPLPFKNDFFDVLLVPFACRKQHDLASTLPEFSRVLAHGGRLVLSVMHPMLEILLLNQNPATSSRTHFMLQDYFALLKDHDLYVENILESMIDKETKSFFSRTDQTHFFDEFCGIPLVLFLRAVRFLKK